MQRINSHKRCYLPFLAVCLAVWLLSTSDYVLSLDNDLYDKMTDCLLSFPVRELEFKRSYILY